MAILASCARSVSPVGLGNRIQHLLTFVNSYYIIFFEGANMLTIEQIIEKLKDRNSAEVARRIGISRAAISSYVLGKSFPSYRVLKKFSEYFGDEKK
jgi:transcriptional regulator with XRE-family HTH domain